MTSNTTPSGECSASDIYSEKYDAWVAFAGGAWNGSNGNTSGWIQYKFDRPVVIKKVTWSNPIGADRYLSIKEIRILASTDGISFNTELASYTNTSLDSGKVFTIDFQNKYAYIAYRFVVDSINQTKGYGKYVVVNNLQFYGRSQN